MCHSCFVSNSNGTYCARKRGEPVGKRTGSSENGRRTKTEEAEHDQNMYMYESHYCVQFLCASKNIKRKLSLNADETPTNRQVGKEKEVYTQWSFT